MMSMTWVHIPKGVLNGAPISTLKCLSFALLDEEEWSEIKGIATFKSCLAYI